MYINTHTHSLSHFVLPTHPHSNVYTRMEYTCFDLSLPLCVRVCVCVFVCVCVRVRERECVSVGGGVGWGDSCVCLFDGEVNWTTVFTLVFL